MQAVWVLIHIVLFGRVILNYTFVIGEKHFFDGAHLVPCGAALPLAITRRNADVLPSSAVTGNAEERSAAHEYLEATIFAITFFAVEAQLCIGVSILIQGVEILHLSTPPSRWPSASSAS